MGRRDGLRLRTTVRNLAAMPRKGSPGWAREDRSETSLTGWGWAGFLDARAPLVSATAAGVQLFARSSPVKEEVHDTDRGYERANAHDGVLARRRDDHEARKAHDDANVDDGRGTPGRSGAWHEARTVRPALYDRPNSASAPDADGPVRLPISPDAEGGLYR